MTFFNWFLLLLLSLLWGMSFFFVELALASFPPFSLVLVRVGVAALMMAWFIRHLDFFRYLKQRWKPYLITGFFGAGFPFFCFAWGQQYIDSSVASIINSLTPMATYLLVVSIGREAFNGVRLFGVILGFVGVIILINPQTDMDVNVIGGMLLATVAAFSYAVAATTASHQLRGYPPSENAFGQLFFATLFIFPFAVFEAPWQSDFSIIGVSSAIGLAVFSTFFAFLIYYRLISSAGAVNTVLVTLLIPIVAIALGYFALDEVLTPHFFLGCAVILGGLVLTDEKLKAYFKESVFKR